MKQVIAKKKPTKQAPKIEYTRIQGTKCMHCGEVLSEPFSNRPHDGWWLADASAYTEAQHEADWQCIEYLKAIINEMKRDFTNEIEDLKSTIEDLSEQVRRDHS